MRPLCCALILGTLAACGSSTNHTRSSMRSPQSTRRAPRPEPNPNDMILPTANGPSGGNSGGFILANPSSGSPPRSGGSSLSPPPPPPPPRELPPSNPNSGGFILAAPNAPPPPPPRPASPSNESDLERGRAVIAAAAFERALNASDLSSAERISTASCWSKECASIARQAQTKFKVKLVPGITHMGTRGLAEMDVLCGGTRQCDKVWLLLEKDCISGTRFVVADVTEDKSKRENWLKNAPSFCGGSSTAASGSPAFGSTSPQPLGDIKAGATTATRPIADADRVIAGLRPRLRLCFTNGLKADPKMNGRVMYTVSVAGDGSVTTANVVSNTGIAFDVVTCQVGVLKRAQFTAPGGSGSTLNVPITLSVSQ